MPMTALLRANTVATASMAPRLRPDWCSSASQGWARTASANASKPWVCSAMNAVSSTRGPPAACAASSSARTCLHTPVSAATSPPMRTWWYWLLIGVSTEVSISFTCCGLRNRSSARSRSGLNVIIGTPRLCAFCSSFSMRGLLVPGFCPAKISRSALSKSSSVTVPLGAPMLAGSATEVGSWHMLELSGRLLLPSMRANRPYM